MIFQELSDATDYVARSKTSSIAVFELEEGYRCLYANTVVTRSIIRFGFIPDRIKGEILSLEKKIVAESTTPLDSSDRIVDYLEGGSDEEILLGVFEPKTERHIIVKKLQ
ncbi:MAG: hypothetical protein ACREVA_00020 [Burkholderiales bacterium]